MKYLFVNNFLSPILKKYEGILNSNLLFIAFSLPFYRSISSISTIILILLWLMKGNIIGKIKLVFTDKYAILFTSLFFIPAVSIFYSSDIDNGLFNIEKSLSLLIFPLVLFSYPSLKSGQINNILFSFCTGCITASVIAFFNALIVNYSINRLESFIAGLYDTNMITILGISHVYFGIYLAFALLILTNAYLNKQYFFKRKWLHICIYIYLLVFFILLGAKMAIISFFIILVIILTIYIIKSRKYFLAFLGAFSIITIFYLSIIMFPVTKERFQALIDKNNYQVGDNQWNSIGSRVSILYCTKEIIIQNWLLGVGIGDTQNILNKCFMANNFSTLYNMNVHNQFLQYIITSGVLTLLLFLMCLIYPLYPFCKNITLKSSNSLYISFIGLFTFCCLTESVLESNKGIIFYSYFNTVLFLHLRK